MTQTRAQELVNKAHEMEQRQINKLGRIVYKFYQNDFEGFDLDIFKGEVGKILKKTRVFKKPV